MCDEFHLRLPITFQVVVAGDDLDVDVLGHRGEGDLETADGGSVTRLHLG